MCFFFFFYCLKSCWAVFDYQTDLPRRYFDVANFPSFVISLATAPVAHHFKVWFLCLCIAVARGYMYSKYILFLFLFLFWSIKIFCLKRINAREISHCSYKCNITISKFPIMNLHKRLSCFCFRLNLYKHCLIVSWLFLISSCTWY